MPQPTAIDVHVDRLMTEISVGYRNLTYIADQWAPMVPVQKRTDRIPKYNQSPFFRNDAKPRAVGTRSKGSGYTLSTTDTYYCDRYSFRHEVPDEVADNMDQPFNADRDATLLVTDKMQMVREVQFASNLFTSSVWGTADKVGGADFTVWSNYALSTPLPDFEGWKETVEGLIGLEPTVFGIGRQVLTKLKWHPQLIDTIKYVQRGVLTEDLIASLFGIKKLLIGRAIYTTSVEGTAEASVTYTRIWGKHGLLLFEPDSPSLLSPAASYTFVWQRVANALQYIKRMRDEEAEISIFESNSYFHQKKLVTNAGLFASGIVA